MKLNTWDIFVSMLLLCVLLQLDSYDNTYDRQWASRLSDSLSWAEEGEEDDNFTEELLRVSNSWSKRCFSDSINLNLNCI